jgi:cholesterol transport system auxiliary component
MHVRRSLLLALAALAGGCGLSKPYPAKQLYALDVPAPDREVAVAGGAVLRVQPVQVTRPFGEQTFHYRVGTARFEADYYLNFIDEPGRLVTAELIEWLAATGDFAAVVDASSTVQTERSVQLIINELYADTSDPRIHQAVVAARFFLLDDREVETRVLLTRDYRETELVSGEGGDALVAAWGAALDRIFRKIVADISTVP